MSDTPDAPRTTRKGRKPRVSRATLPLAQADETFQFLALTFNVTAAIARVSGRAPAARVDPRRLLSDFVRVDEARARSDAIDPDVPGIAVTLPDGARLPIDGHHRAAKAVRLGRADVPVHILTVEESRAVCCTPAVWARLEQDAARRAGRDTAAGAAPRGPR